MGGRFNTTKGQRPPNPLPTFHAANVGPMKATPVGQLILGEALLLSEGAGPETEFLFEVGAQWYFGRAGVFSQITFSRGNTVYQKWVSSSFVIRRMGFGGRAIPFKSCIKRSTSFFEISLNESTSSCLSKFSAFPDLLV